MAYSFADANADDFGDYGGYEDRRPNMRQTTKRKTVDYSAGLVSYYENRIFERDVRDRECIEPHSSYKRALIHPIGLVDLPASSICSRFCHQSKNRQSCPINAGVWSPEGRRFITGNEFGQFTLWYGGSFNFETLRTCHDTAVRAMAWTHNGNFLISAEDKGVIKYHDTSFTNIQALSGHKQAVRDLSFSPSDHKFASCSDDQTIAVWDWETGRQERVLTGHGWNVNSVQWHPSLPMLASGSKDNKIMLWDAKTGRELHKLHLHSDSVNKVAWNPNGNWLLTASRDHTLKLLDIRMMRELFLLRGHEKDITAVAWHPVHERLVVSGGQSGEIFYWIIGNETLAEGSAGRAGGQAAAAGQQQPCARVENAHAGPILAAAWHPVGHVLATSSKDHFTRFWARPRPGEPILNSGEEDNTSAPPPAPVPVPVASVSVAATGGFGFTAGPDGVGAGSQPLVRRFGGASAPVGNPAGPAAAVTGIVGGGTPFAPPARVAAALNSGVPPDYYTCNRCGEKGHYVQDCTAKDSVMKPPPDYTCRVCNIKGHFIKDCPQGKRRIPPPEYICHGCKQKGHYRQDCPSAPGGGGGPAHLAAAMASGFGSESSGAAAAQAGASGGAAQFMPLQFQHSGFGFQPPFPPQY